VNIDGPTQGTVGDNLVFKGVAKTSGDCSTLQFNWTLRTAPPGADPWSATGEQVTFTPKVAGDHTLRLDLVASSQSSLASAEQKLSVVAKGAQQPPPSQPPQPQPGTGVQEFAIILGTSNNAFHTFPATLNVPAGSLRIFLTSLDRTVTVVLRKDGAQAGVATVLVEQGKLATAEVSLSQGSYGLLDQASNNQLGQIQAK
jgi:hypothetical protein